MKYAKKLRKPLDDYRQRISPKFKFKLLFIFISIFVLSSPVYACGSRYCYFPDLIVLIILGVLVLCSFWFMDRWFFTLGIILVFLLLSGAGIGGIFYIIQNPLRFAHQMLFLGIWAFAPFFIKNFIYAIMDPPGARKTTVLVFLGVLVAIFVVAGLNVGSIVKEVITRLWVSLMTTPNIPVTEDYALNRD